MDLLLTVVVLLLVLAAGTVWWMRSSARPAPAPVPLRRSAAPVPSAGVEARVPRAAPATLSPDAAPSHEPPPALAAFDRRSADALEASQRQAIVEQYRDVPRPPRLLQHLMSPEFFEAANSSQLVGLITAEPHIAAKVLGAVNSPVYALKAPVNSLGQAVTFLGLSAVRSLCLQYILINAFQADSPERKRVLESTWRASALASELAHQLTYRLGWTDGGLVVSAVVLSFLGRLASAATMPRDRLVQVPSRDFLQRSQAEQDQLGLCAGEIGRLLMTDWGLPPGIAQDAADIDTVLVAPAARLDAARRHRLALGYLCVRLGERLAEGECENLLDLELADEVEWFHLRAHLGDPRLARVVEFIRAPALNNELQRMRGALRF